MKLIATFAATVVAATAILPAAFAQTTPPAAPMASTSKMAKKPMMKKPMMAKKKMGKKMMKKKMMSKKMMMKKPMMKKAAPKM